METEKYEQMNRYEKMIHTRKQRYSDEQRKEWARKAGKTKGRPKGFAANPKLAAEVAWGHKRRRENENTYSENQ